MAGEEKLRILAHYWRPVPIISPLIGRALEKAVDLASRSNAKKIDEVMLDSLRAQGLDAKARERILDGRKFEDDIRLHAGDEEVSIEIENDGNRLEFDILKMLSFAEAVSNKHRAYGCLVIPANKRLSNPYISGSGKERIWDYVTGRLLPMILPVQGVRLDNILVLGYERSNLSDIPVLVTSPVTGPKEKSLRGLVHREWIKAGKPPWNVDDTLKVAVDADERLERNNLGNPAEEFRANRKAQQLEYLRRWIRGCKFEWLTKH